MFNILIHQGNALIGGGMSISGVTMENVKEYLRKLKVEPTILLLYHWSQWKLTYSTAEISMFVVALFSIANFQMSLLPINERMDKEI